MDALPDPVAVAAGWRPQRYGRRLPAADVDAIVEPLWGGVRLLAAIRPGTAALMHDGRVLEARADLLQALAESLTAEAVVVEGHATAEALGTGEGAFPEPEEPGGGPLRLLAGSFLPRSRRRELREAAEASARDRELETRALAAVDGPDPVAFVATDLLWIDGQPLLDVPLLERKRLLEASVSESWLVRRTVYVQPTARPTLIAWRTLGFTHLVYRATNGRYRPGEVNAACTTAASPVDGATGGQRDRSPR